MTTDFLHGLGCLPTPPELLARGWPITLALAEAPTAAPLKFHSPKCDTHVTVDQDGVGACVAFSGAYVQAAQELADEGRQLNPKILDPLATYFEVKGIPFRGWGTPDPSPGLYPPQLWDYAKRVGWATQDGSPRRKDAAYYTLGRPSIIPAFLDALQQTILQLGPFQFTCDWPTNWFSTDARGFMMPPTSTLAGGHAFECCGYEVFPTGCPILSGCTWDSFHHQSWGPFGKDPEYPDHFRVHSPWWNRLGREGWKVLDQTGDAPTPPVPVETIVTITDPTPKTVDLPIGTQLYRTDGKTTFVKVSSGGAGIYSPAGGPTTTQRYVVVSSGGIRQAAVVNVAGLTFKPFGPDIAAAVAAAVAAEHKRWTDWVATQPKGA